MSQNEKIGRPEIQIDLEQLTQLMRLQPSLEDTASVMGCGQSKIHTFLRDNLGVTFQEFREQNKGHARIKVMQKALEAVDKGSIPMIIFCLKNLWGWSDAKHIDVNFDAPKEASAELQAQIDKILKISNE